MAMAETHAPAIFISHGSPTTVFDDDDYTRALRRFGEENPKPKAIAIISAHGVASSPLVVIGANPTPELWYDFHGFQPDLYQYRYPCKGDSALSFRISTLVAQAGLKIGIDPHNRLDHGVWVPLSIAYPKADIPVVQIAMPTPNDPRTLYAVGRALASLRSEGFLLVGSGGTTHNLRNLRWSDKYGSPDSAMLGFQDWVTSAVRENRVDELFDYEKQPNAAAAHPTWEHFYPLFFTLGARLPSDHFAPIYEGFEYGTLSMFSFALK